MTTTDMAAGYDDTQTLNDIHGMPTARVDADGTQVFIRPNGPGLLIQVSPLSQADADALEIAVAGKVIRHPRPPRGRA